MAQLGSITIQAPLEPFLNSAEVGKIFGVSARTIERWAEEGTFPPAKTQGRNRVWSNLAVAAYMLWMQVGPEQKESKAGPESE